MWSKRHKRVLSATGTEGERLYGLVVNAMSWALWPTLPDHSPLHRVPGNARRVIQMSSVSLLKVKKWCHLVVSNSLRHHGLQPARLPHPWNFPGNDTGVGCDFQGIFSRGSSRPRDQTQVSHIVVRLFTVWATREALWVCYSFQIWILSLTLT